MSDIGLAFGVLVGVTLLVLGIILIGSDSVDLRIQQGSDWCNKHSTLDTYFPRGYDSFQYCPIVMTKTTCTTISVETKSYQEAIDKVVVGNYTTIYANGDKLIVNELFDLNDDIVNSIIVYDKQRFIFDKAVEEIEDEKTYDELMKDSPRSTYTKRVYEYEIIDKDSIIKSGTMKSIPKCTDYENDVVILKDIRS